MENQFDIWLNRLNLDQYAEIFRENDIDFDSIRLLSDADLKALGLSLGHRRRLLAAVADLETSSSPPSTGSDISAPADVSLGERRQLTVMFCDIVGSTRLAQKIDPEDLREIILQFQNSVVAAANKYGGFVAKFLGDGALCYFGWPRAFEDQAERAVRAALDALGDIQSISTQQKQKLRVRIGIETGEVVIGDLIGSSSTEERAIVGETPNLASRLQSSAKAGQIVIGPVSRDLLGTTFELRDNGPQKLKGFAERVNTWQVLRESDAESRFDAIRGIQSSPITGRELELNLLNQSWEMVQNGEGQTVLVSGEAGMGKSRLISEFSGQFSDVAEVFRFQCAPLHINNAFLPIKQYLRLNAHILQTDPDEIKFGKLREFLDGLPTEQSKSVPIFNRLLDINITHELTQSEHTPGQFRDEVVQNTTRLITEKASDGPVMVIVEDTHWADPSTRQFIKHLANKIPDHRILLLISYRPEDKSNWKDVNAQLSLELEGLGTNEALTVVKAISVGQLNDPVVEQIISRSDGNPLCLEELTKTLLDSSQPNEDVSNEALIPATLQSSLIARLDQLNAAREVAQIGAVIGQSFRFDILKKVSDKPIDEIMHSMDQLVSSGLIHRRDHNENTIFVFKHALVHDAAYSTILRARRRVLHLQIVEILEREG
ncbi:MAG: adenylate/guanylate cyclase domain-containing protein, partial [Methyloligellaceae bacterium]